LCQFRGHGESNIEDYHAPHTIEGAIDDILTLVSVVCPTNLPVNAGAQQAQPASLQPQIIIASGTLGAATAISYLQNTCAEVGDTIGNSKKLGATRFTHSEVSGPGAIQAPSLIILLPAVEEGEENEKEKESNISHINGRIKTSMLANEWSDEISELHGNAQQFIQEHNAFYPLEGSKQIYQVGNCNVVSCASIQYATDYIEQYFNQNASLNK
jgi:hypothetical protein